MCSPKEEVLDKVEEEVLDKVEEEVLDKVEEEVLDKVEEEVLGKVEEEVLDKVEEEVLDKVEEEVLGNLLVVFFDTSVPLNDISLGDTFLTVVSSLSTESKIEDEIDFDLDLADFVSFSI
jgi:hypothetical protein